MRIGVLGCFFGKPEYLDSCLEPWLQVDGELEDHEFVFAVVNAQFKERAHLEGITEDEEMQNKLYWYESQNYLDFLFVSESPLYEHQARNVPLQYLLKRDIDYLILLDLDEFWTTDQIYKAIEIIEKNQDYTTFDVHMKNIIFDGNHFIRGFHPPRIFSNRKNGGMLNFVWDNDIRYKDGSLNPNRGLIKEEELFIKHLTWLNEDGEKKVEYHMKHFGTCSYLWDKREKKLELNREYYLENNYEIPKIEKND